MVPNTFTIWLPDVNFNLHRVQVFTFQVYTVHNNQKVCDSHRFGPGRPMKEPWVVMGYTTQHVDQISNNVCVSRKLGR